MGMKVRNLWGEITKPADILTIISKEMHAGYGFVLMIGYLSGEYHANNSLAADIPQYFKILILLLISFWFGFHRG